MNPVVSFQNVVKEYRGRRVVSSLSFEVHHGEVVGMLGRSGIGKTTILKIAAGLEKVSSGKVEVNARRIGCVFQESRLFPWKTALENIMLPLAAIGLKRKEARSRAEHHLTSMGLDGFGGYYPAYLSGGMRQRVALARAFAVEPDLLLLDEPFSALDLKMRHDLLEMLGARLRDRPMTVLYVSHSPREVSQVATRVFMMSSGSALEKVEVSPLGTVRNKTGQVLVSQQWCPG